jgi:DNA invertase Pin-like site-specific DNA recombinase
MSLPKAYSYVRFSTPEQSRGDSFSRQFKKAQEYAERYGLELDETLTLRDEGVSAFKGKNVEEGRLGFFLDEVDRGNVSQGSYLLVENLDRLSRDLIMKALRLLTSILEKGINVVTLDDQKVYTADSLDNFGDLLIALATMARANDESARKSERISNAWASKRKNAVEEGRPLTSMVPSWLRLDKDRGEYEIAPDKAEVVRRVFSEYLAGYGMDKIVERLNADGVPPISGRGTGWHVSYISRLLRNEAVIGRFQPHVEVEPPEGSAPNARRRRADGDAIDAYFPAIIDAKTFARARRQRTSKSKASGPRGKTFSNILSGLVTCGQCGGKMHRTNKGKPPKGFPYLVCSNAKRNIGGCHARMVRFDQLIPIFINCLNDDDLDLGSMLGETASTGVSETQKDLAEEIESAEGQVEEVDEKIASLIAALEMVRSDQARKTIAGRMDALTEEREELVSKQMGLSDDLAEATDSSVSHAEYVNVLEATIEEWNSVVARGAAEPARLYDLNLRLNSALKRLIETINVSHDTKARDWVAEMVRDHPFPSSVDELAKDITADHRVGVSVNVKFRNSDRRQLVIFITGTRRTQYAAIALMTDGCEGVKAARLTLGPMSTRSGRVSWGSSQ